MFLATSDVAGLAMKTRPFQFSENEFPLQRGQTSFSTKSRHFLQTFRAMVTRLSSTPSLLLVFLSFYLLSTILLCRAEVVSW